MPGPAPCPICRTDEHLDLLFEAQDFELGIPDVYKLRRCSRCELLVVSPQPELETLLKHYPPSMNCYEDNPFALAARLWRVLHRREAADLARLLPAKAAVMDVGCSKGQFLDHLKTHGEFELHGLDFNEDILEEARGKGYDVRHCSVEDAPLEARRYDLMRMNNVIEHLYEPRKALENILQALRPGGWLVGETPNAGSLDFSLLGRYWGGLSVPRHLVLFSGKTLTRFLTDIGFTDIRISNKLSPTGWSGGMQNLITRSLGLPASPTGRPKWYLLLVLASLPLNLPQFLLGSTGFMGFRARKPGNGR